MAILIVPIGAVTSRRDVWIETLSISSGCASAYKSHPVGMCGLKPWDPWENRQRLLVTSRRDVWIETCVNHFNHFGTSVTSRRDVWIETFLSISSSHILQVTSRRDVWIETLGLRSTML